MSKPKAKDVAFWGLLVAGVGFCVGGIFFPPLIAASGACFSVAIALAKGEPREEAYIHRSNPNAPIEDNKSDSSDDKLDLDVHTQVNVNRHHRRHYHPSFKLESRPNDDSDHKEDSPDRDNKRPHHKKHP